MVTERLLKESQIAAWTFLAASHPHESCGINGLPLTPNSVRILGKFQFLLSLDHPNLCKYLDLIRGKHGKYVTFIKLSMLYLKILI